MGIADIAKLGEAWDIVSYKVTIQQKGSEQNFRAIIQMGDPKGKTATRSLAGRKTAMIFSSWWAKSTFSDALKESYGLPSPEGSDYYAATANMDASHKNDEFIYYLSYEGNNIVATPKIYSDDRMAIIRMHGFLLLFGEEIFTATGEQFISLAKFPVTRNNQVALPSDVYQLDSFWKTTGIKLQ